MSERPWWVLTLVRDVPLLMVAESVLQADEFWRPFLPAVVQELLALAPVCFVIVTVVREYWWRRAHRAPAGPVSAAEWAAAKQDFLVFVALLVLFVPVLGLAGLLPMPWASVVALSAVGGIAVAGRWIRRWRGWTTGLEGIRWLGYLAQRAPITIGVLGILPAATIGVVGAYWVVAKEEWINALVAVLVVYSVGGGSLRLLVGTRSPKSPPSHSPA